MNSALVLQCALFFVINCQWRNRVATLAGKAGKAGKMVFFQKLAGKAEK